MLNGDFKVIICCEHPIIPAPSVDYTIEQFVAGGTKFSKLQKVLKDDDSEFIISIDNDVIVKPQTFYKFIEECMSVKADISWARLSAKDSNTFVAKLVQVDKLLSHNYIRPLLWKIGCGISITGQCFLIRRRMFLYISFPDTYLDDIALGLFINRNRKILHIITSKEVIANEKPNTSFSGLLLQRKRWANGYATLIKNVPDDFLKIFLHGCVYHFNWCLHFAVFGWLAYLSSCFAIFYLLLLSIVICMPNWKLVGYGIVYHFVFCILHIYWGYNVIQALKRKS